MNTPLENCAASTVISDIITVVIYVFYILRSKLIKISTSAHELISIYKNSLSYSIEKLLSASSLTVISNIFFAGISVASSSLYYNIENLFSPLTMLPYCYFDWILYSHTKKLVNPSRKNYICYGLLLALMALFTAFYLNIAEDFPILIIYIANSVVFLMEKEYIAIYFSDKVIKIANNAVAIKSVLIILTLFVVSSIGYLNLINIMLIQLFYLLAELFVLYRFYKSIKYAKKISAQM